MDKIYSFYFSDIFLSNVGRYHKFESLSRWSKKTINRISYKTINPVRDFF